MTRQLRIVFEVEEEPLLQSGHTLNRECIDLIAMILSNCSNSEKEVILVSAGAIAAGVEKLGLEESPHGLNEKQAISAIGQVELIRRYQNVFDEYNQMIAQVLLDRNVTDDPGRSMNARNTFERLITLNVIPVINENDVTSTDDIELENNYPLTRAVAGIAKADAIIIMHKDFSFSIIISGTHDSVHAKDKDALFHELAVLTEMEITPGLFPKIYSI